MSDYSIGMIGLGVMGQNLALNMESKGFSVAAYYRKKHKEEAARKLFAGKKVKTVMSYPDLIQALERPRKVLLMVTAGKPVDDVIQELKPLLEKGDILIDGGNSLFVDTDRRVDEAQSSGLRYIGTGVSGGEEGALKGPAIMPGGHEDAYREIEPIFTGIAAKTDDGPCCGYIGQRGAGHYVKMVHNGIEYGIMQLICEVYDIMKSLLGMKPAEMQPIFAAWNDAELNSYLIEITAAVLGKIHPETGEAVVDIILDRAGQKGTGKWTSQNALDLGAAIPTINAALEGRIISAFKDERVGASKVLQGPGKKFEGDKGKMIERLREALRLAIITSYAQGFALMREASKEYSYNLHFREIARIWKGGCIIRAKLLDPIRDAFGSNAELPNLLVDPNFSAIANQLQPSLREVVSAAVVHGVPCFGLAASLGYIDSYRQARLPANLLQGLRDYFGAHQYERVDKPRGEMFHTDWLA
jgi:6-phosphogluconate dehydrogenase